MSEPQAFDSSKPFTVVSAAPPPPVPHPEARMSAAAPPVRIGSHDYGPALPGDADTITFEDLKNDPVDTMKRIGALVKRDATDPKMWLGLAASYFGPKVFAAAAPGLARAAAAVSRGASAVEPGDVIGMISPRAGKAVEMGQKVATAMRGPATAAPSASPASPSASAPVAPVPQGAVPPPPAASAPPPVAPPATAASAPSPVAPPPVQNVDVGPGGLLVGRPGMAPNEPLVGPQGGNPAMPDQRALNEAALAQRRAAYQARMPSAPPAEPVMSPAPEKVKLSGAEYQTLVNLVKRGMPGSEAMKNVLMQRELVSRLGSPTSAQVAADVAHRTATGRWD